MVPVGSDVSFPNLDPTKHHVYSFSPAKKFELKLFARDQSRTVHFDKPGIVALGCNIHDQMSAYILVTNSAWTARTNAQGMVSFADAPSAPGRVTVWHPYLRAPGGIAPAIGWCRPARRQLLNPASAPAVDADVGLLTVPPFRSLSARLTVQFALLFAAAMLIVTAALSSVIAGSASREVANQLQSSGAVYDRLWDQRAHELQSAAQLLARDFGFREAVASGDAATMRSALGNSAARLKVRSAFIISADGHVTSTDRTFALSEAGPLWDALDAGRMSGVSILGGKPRQLVAAPIMAPNLVGWVIFSSDLDRREMRGLEQLSAIPLHAAVLTHGHGRWYEAAGSMGGIGGPSAALALRHVGSAASFEMNVGERPSITLAKPLPTLVEGERAILLLAYPKSEALADARKLQLALAAMTLLGLVLVAFATWKAASRITKPLARLDEAAGRLASGEPVQVKVRGTDELARLATSFNEMVGKIAEREQRITQLAFNDVLTGLPNRSMFQQQLEHMLRASRGNASQFALHCLDLDQFKTINDTLGHPAGDALLIESARRLQEAAGGHFVARLGGDEFVVLQSVGSNRDSIDRLARAILQTMAQPFRIDANELAPSTSIGIAISPQDGSDGGDLLRNADLALYRAKEAGRGTYAFFEESLNQRAQQRHQTETDLRLAIDNNEFELFYQPQFDLEENRICSFEALIRWNHPKRGVISPADFVPIAEETGLIVPIGNWVIRRACARSGALAGQRPRRGQCLADPVPPRRASRNHPARARRHRAGAEPVRG